MTRRRNIAEVRDSKLFFLIYDVGGRAKSMHDRMIAHIVEALYNKGYRRINYDHVKEFVKKEVIPLNIGGRKWDIVVQTGKEEYVAIEVKTFRKADIKEHETETEECKDG